MKTDGWNAFTIAGWVARRWMLAGASLTLAGLTSCGSSRELMVSHAAAAAQDSLLEHREHNRPGTHRSMTGKNFMLEYPVVIRAYTMRDGQRIQFDGTVEPNGDTLRFVQLPAPKKNLQAGRTGEVRLVPRDSVLSVAEYESSTGRSIIAAVLVFGGLILAVIYGMASTAWGT